MIRPQCPGVAHPSNPLPDAVRFALALGLFSFVGGIAFALWRANCRVKLGRLVVTIATSLTVYFLADVPAVVSLGIAFGGVTVVAFMEERAAERLRAHPSA